MALIKCPDCGTEVSDMATVCPRCARPIAHVAQVQTIEATGKEVKAAKAGGCLLFVVGAPLWLAGNAADSNIMTALGGLFTIGGLSTYVVARVSGWWKHE